MAKQIVLQGEKVDFATRDGREVVAMKATNDQVTAAVVLESSPEALVDVDCLRWGGPASFTVTIERVEN